MADHSLLYAYVGVFERFGFPLSPAESQSLGELRQDYRPLADLRDDVTGLIDRLIRCHLDVIVVNQTTPEHRRADLTCIKVLVPGLLPMTFGHHNRRTEGLPRLFSFARADDRLHPTTAPEYLNPYPHPFP